MLRLSDLGFVEEHAKPSSYRSTDYRRWIEIDLSRFSCMVHLSPTLWAQWAGLAPNPRLGCASPGAITLSASSADSVNGPTEDWVGGGPALQAR